jgi:hypothetical protein
MALDKIASGANTYYQLKISCPVCVDQGRNTQQSFWQHGTTCGGAIYIGNDAHFLCKICRTSAHVKQWRFNCPSHSGATASYLSPSSAGFAQAISTAGQMVSETGHRWLMEFMGNMGEF